MDLAGDSWNGFAVYVDLSRLSIVARRAQPYGKGGGGGGGGGV